MKNKQDELCKDIATLIMAMFASKEDIPKKEFNNIAICWDMQLHRELRLGFYCFLRYNKKSVATAIDFDIPMLIDDGYMVNASLETCLEINAGVQNYFANLDRVKLSEEQLKEIINKYEDTEGDDGE